MAATEEQRQAAPFRNIGGPHGLGDPDDTRLRKVEREVCIPKKMRDIARIEKCTAEVEEFNKCCRTTGVAMVVKCRQPNTVMRSCLEHWYLNEEFKNRCKEEYLVERSVYRSTGLTKKQRAAQAKEADTLTP